MNRNRRLTTTEIIRSITAIAILSSATGFPVPARADETTAASVITAPVPLFEGLGPHNRNVTTKSADARRYFNQGLNFLFAFNHDEAIRSFRQAAVADPECAMAYWGVAIANGPHINFPMVPPDRAKAAWEALTRAKALAANASDVEKALIDALSRRYADPQPEDRRPLDEAYAAAMRAVWKRFPSDTDAGALFAEALMDLRPWDLWTKDGKPQPETPEILATLEAVQAKNPTHPLALHLYIHAVEAGPNPEKGEKAAGRLRLLQPGLGHMVHMPSHIDVRLGKWQQAIEANQRATAADRRYVAKSGKEQGFYRVYMAHNRHMLAFAAMMQGDSRRAHAAIKAMLDEMPAKWKTENVVFADGYHAMPFELMVRFGQWEEILKQPEPAEHFPIARALRHSSRGIALAAMGKTNEARESQRAFNEAVAKVPKDAFFGNNAAGDLFAIANAMLEGEILFREGKREEGLAMLRKAVTAEDQLRYDEPPDWIRPVRHALGAALMADGKAKEAEAVYRADLKIWPHNGWSLFGLSQALEAQGRKKEAAQMAARYKKAWRRADVALTSSCFCQPGSK